MLSPSRRGAAICGAFVTLLVLLGSARAADAAVIDWKRWGGVLVPGEWNSFAAGDFTGDGLDDVLAYRHRDGLVSVGVNTGSYFDFKEAWIQVGATALPEDAWSFVAGKFDDDNLLDIVGYSPADGTLTLFTQRIAHDGSRRFAAGRVLSNLQPKRGWSFVAGNFVGTKHDDILGYSPSDGSVRVGENRLSAGVQQLAFSQWATVDPKGDWSFTAGDFTRDGKLDIVAYYPFDGSVYVGINTGAQKFTFTRWATLDAVTSVAFRWQIVSGKFAGDGNTDIAAYWGDGSVFGGRNALGTFFLQEFAAKSPQTEGRRHLLAGKFTRGDDRVDLFALDPHDGALWVGANVGLPPEGYAWPLSAAPGEAVQLHTSGRLDPTVTYYRYTFAPGHIGEGQPVASPRLDKTWAGSGTLLSPSTVRPLPAAPWQNGCSWPSTHTIKIPTSWPSGIYAAEIKNAETPDTFSISFVVKPGPVLKRIAVIANVNTWNAYNRWGGKGKYPGHGSAGITSFLRPNPEASPSGASSGAHLTAGEVKILAWLEASGFPADVYTDIDFDKDNTLLTRAAGYEKIILSTHPEYWTAGMLTKLKAFLDASGSVLYLGGNGLFEAVTYTSNGTALAFVGGTDGAPREDQFFRVKDDVIHEQSLLGVSTARCKPVTSDYRVLELSHPLFLGSGLSAGQTFGHGASGDEVDNTLGGTSLPPDCGFAPRAVKPYVARPNLVILAEARETQSGALGAQMAFYRYKTNPANAAEPFKGFVFSAGSVMFGAGMVQDGPLQKILHQALNMR